GEAHEESSHHDPSDECDDVDRRSVGSPRGELLRMHTEATTTTATTSDCGSTSSRSATRAEVRSPLGELHRQSRSAVERHGLLDDRTAGGLDVCQSTNDGARNLRGRGARGELARVSGTNTKRQACGDQGKGFETRRDDRWLV